MRYEMYGSNVIYKVDITRREVIIFEPQELEIFKQYSDMDEEDEIVVKVYSLNEILIEKMTALIGRTIPRDLFDFDYLLEKEGLKIVDVYMEFMIKAESKGHDPKCLYEKVSGKEATCELPIYANAIDGLRASTEVLP